MDTKITRDYCKILTCLQTVVKVRGNLKLIILILDILRLVYN